MKYTALIGDQTYDIEIEPNGVVRVNGQVHAIDFQNIETDSLYSLLIDNRSWQAAVSRSGDEFRVSIDGEVHAVTVQDERTRKIQRGLGKLTPPSGEVTVKAPMPGLVRGVAVQAGDEVTQGQGLVILEAMKMENELRAPRPGAVKDVRVKVGDKVEQGQALVVIK